MTKSVADRGRRERGQPASKPNIVPRTFEIVIETQ